jgi:hypothetical protein
MREFRLPYRRQNVAGLGSRGRPPNRSPGDPERVLEEGRESLRSRYARAEGSLCRSRSNATAMTMINPVMIS